MSAQETPGYSERLSELLDEERARLALGGISRATLFRLRQRRELKSVEIGRRVFFRVTDIADYIDRHTVGGP